jgi:hypothetical protein
MLQLGHEMADARAEEIARRLGEMERAHLKVGNTDQAYAFGSARHVALGAISKPEPSIPDVMRGLPLLAGEEAAIRADERAKLAAYLRSIDWHPV